MKWIPTKHNADGTITIKEKVYGYPVNRNYRVVEGFAYIEDPDHTGTAYVSEQINQKYNLELDEGDLIDEDEREELEEKFGENFLHKYSFVISHCIGCVDSEGNEHQMQSPKGDTTTEEFICWYNSFSAELLKEPEEEVVWMSWCEG